MDDITTKEGIAKKPEIRNLEEYALLIQDSIKKRGPNESPQKIIDSMIHYYIHFFLDLASVIGEKEALDIAKEHTVIADNMVTSLVEHNNFKEWVDSQKKDRTERIRASIEQLAA